MAAAPGLRETLEQRLQDLGIAATTAEHPEVGSRGEAPAMLPNAVAVAAVGCGLREAGDSQPSARAGFWGPFQPTRSTYRVTERGSGSSTSHFICVLLKFLHKRVRF